LLQKLPSGECVMWSPVYGTTCTCTANEMREGYNYDPEL
jgi:hypothetical protein